MEPIFVFNVPKKGKFKMVFENSIFEEPEKKVKPLFAPGEYERLLREKIKKEKLRVLKEHIIEEDQKVFKETPSPILKRLIVAARKELRERSNIEKRDLAFCHSYSHYDFRVWNIFDREMQLPNRISYSGRLMTIETGMGYGDTDDKYIVMRCTGFNDKKNNTVYEGDIFEDKIAFRGKTYNCIYEVIWDYSEGRFLLDGCYVTEKGTVKTDYKEICQVRDLEILGNIYENPELME